MELNELFNAPVLGVSSLMVCQQSLVLPHPLRSGREDLPGAREGELTKNNLNNKNSNSSNSICTIILFCAVSAFIGVIFRNSCHNLLTFHT